MARVAHSRELLTHHFSVGRERFEFTCEQNMVAEAEWLKWLVGDWMDHGGFERWGARISLGFGTLEVAGEGNEYTILEVDYDGDPYVETRPDISCSLRILQRQVTLSKLLGFERADCQWGQTLIRGPLAGSAHFYLERMQPTAAADSGWYMGPLDGAGVPAIEQLERVTLYRVTREFPDVAAVLPLPIGHLVVFKDSVVVGIAAADGAEIWNRDRGPSF